MNCVTCDHLVVEGNAGLAILQDMMIAAATSEPSCMDCSHSICNDDHFWMTDDETYLCCSCKGKRATNRQKWGSMKMCIGCGGYFSDDPCPYCESLKN